MKIRIALIAGVALSLGACQSKTTETTENTVETNSAEIVSEGDNAVLNEGTIENGTELENGSELGNATN